MRAGMDAGTMQQEVPVFVAYMDELGLVGMVYLTQNAAYLDFRRGKMKVLGREVPLLPWEAVEFVEDPAPNYVVSTEKLDVLCRTTRQLGKHEPETQHIVLQAQKYVEEAAASVVMEHTRR